MKKNIKVLTALTLSFALMLTGCSLGQDDSKEATEFINDENVDASDEASVELSTSIVVADDMEKPDFNDPTTAASVEATVEEVATENPIDDNLVMVFFGDSQIANGRADKTDIPTLVGQRVPNASVYNLAIGGTTASFDQDSEYYYDYENWTDCSFLGMAYAFSGKTDRNKMLADCYPEVLERMNQVDPASVDYYFIEYGANDFFSKVPLDIYGDDGQPTGVVPEHTYYRSLLFGIQCLRKVSPKAKFVIIYPFYGIYKDGNGAYLGDSYVVSNGYGTLSQYADKAKSLALDQGCYIFDGMYHTKCDLYLDTQDKYLQDSVHLNETGRRIMARLIAHIPNGVEGYEPLAFREGDFIKIDEFNPDETYRMSDKNLEDYFHEDYVRYMNGDYILVQPEG